ncbi:hypothetical protein RUM43_015000 [Polyplax serrata]|uniref:mitogen-activated protein kinase n=1 Tax=Polyplax serrata TaxID=468196 RepID=A0AAN8P0W3_POLSC
MNEKKEENERKDRTNDIDDHISKRYEMKKRLGKGAYGIVWKAVDKKSREIVAVKKIFDAFRNQTDAQRTFREIMFLQAFKDHPNIIRLRGLHRASNNRDIYLVFDYMDTDLHHVIKKGNLLKDIHRRYIMYQLLRATRYLHSGDVIHRDQKPSNILINAECRIKLADFGLARSLANYYAEEETEGPPLLTDYVATRWYRAPEILVASKRYTKGVDMWSLGCILGEMLLGKPLFPGSSTVNQIERIMAVLPKPTTQEIVNMCSGYGKGLLDGALGPKTNLRDLIKSTSEEAIDLVTKLLIFDPTKRLTASQALAHPYVSKFCNGSELSLDHSIIPPLNDDVQLTVAEYRNKLYEMIANGKHASKNQFAGQIIQNKSPAVENVTRKSLENDHKKLTKSTEARLNVDGVKENIQKAQVRKYRSYKNHSVEELREKSGFNNPVMATKSEPSQKTDCVIKKVSSSPQHRSHVPPVQSRTDWSKSMGTQIKNCYIRHRFEKHSKSAECGDEYKMSKTVQNVSSSCGVNHLNTFSPKPKKLTSYQEKLRQSHLKLGNMASLPKVIHKKDYLRQHCSDTASSVSSYKQNHGIITSSELHDIRAVLKH